MKKYYKITIKGKLFLFFRRLFGKKVKENKYTGMTYRELLEETDRVQYGKQARMLHRELKKNHSGLPMFKRYPNFPLWISIAALLLVLLKPVLRGILR